MPSEAQLRKIHAMKEELAIPDEDWANVLRAEVGVSSSKELNPQQASALIENLEREKARRMSEQAALARADPDGGGISMPVPIVDPETFKKNYQRFEEMRNSILARPTKDPKTGREVKPGDVVERQDGMAFIRASGWRKLRLAFGLNTHIVGKDRIPIEDGHALYRVEVEVTAKGGMVTSASAVCTTKEIIDKSKGKVDRSQAEHWAFAMAETRAKSRAIAEMLGGGTVSTEELEADLQE